jgi:hypothetical protein
MAGTREKQARRPLREREESSSENTSPRLAAARHVSDDEPAGNDAERNAEEPRYEVSHKVPASRVPSSQRASALESTRQRRMAYFRAPAAVFLALTGGFAGDVF